MIGSIRALTVTVTAHRSPEGKEAYEVGIDAQEKVPTEWAVGMLRQIADGLEQDPLSGSEPEGSIT